MNHETHKQLLAPFSDSELEWRLQWTNNEKTSGIAVPYITNRAIQNRLDTVVGFENWKNEYIPWHSDGKKASQICGISIYFESRKEWVTKYDGAENSDIEPVKGGLSDSMKRAAVQWGLGRYLYSMDTVFVDVEVRGKTACIAKKEDSKLSRAHQEHILRLFPEATPKQKAHEQAKQEKPQRTGPVEVQKPRPAPQNCVWVDKVVLIPSMSGDNNMNLQLRDANGNTVEAFHKGENPAITQGAALVNTSFSKQTNQGVVFHILDSYQIAEQAA